LASGEFHPAFKQFSSETFRAVSAEEADTAFFELLNCPIYTHSQSYIAAQYARGLRHSNL